MIFYVFYLMRVIFIFLFMVLFFSCSTVYYSVTVTLPSVPSSWDLLDIDYSLFVITDSAYELFVDNKELSKDLELMLPVFSYAVFLLMPRFAGRIDILYPAGGVILPGENPFVSLRWEDGAVVSVLYELVREGFSLSSFNVKRLLEESERRVSSPIFLDKLRLRDAILTGDFSVYDVSEKDCFSVLLDFGSYVWVSADPLNVGSFYGSMEVVLPEGVSRFVSVDTGEIFSVLVDERGRAESVVF
ncbi:hypothetical protein WKV44_00630 [Spirochaetia bacterium 38H-sp]|uniref:Lipoprotein n=1 Tax=Rarispira pelagica TaxID=3141764 RepID=A0ABU9U9A0_9SPIR